MYDNVKSFKTKSIYENKNHSKLFIEGLIKFNSGKIKSTKFVFESKGMNRKNKALFEGFNKQIARANKSFKLICNVKNNKLVSEALNYRYMSNKKLVEGSVKKD